MHLRQKQIRLNLHWIFMNLRSLSMSNLITELIISRIIYHWQIGFMLVFWVALSFQEFTYFKANLWSYCFFLGNSFSIAQSVRRKISTPVFFSFLNFFYQHNCFCSLVSPSHSFSSCFMWHLTSSKVGSWAAACRTKANLLPGISWQGFLWKKQGCSKLYVLN